MRAERQTTLQGELGELRGAVVALGGDLWGLARRVLVAACGWLSERVGP